MWFVKVRRICQCRMGLSILGALGGFFQSMKGCQFKKGLSRYDGFVNVRKVCQDMKGLSL